MQNHTAALCVVMCVVIDAHPSRGTENACG